MLVSWSIGGEGVRTNFLFRTSPQAVRHPPPAHSFFSHWLPLRSLTASPSTATMKYLASLLVLLPLATAEVAKLKLHKIPQVSQNPALETAYLASKYGAPQPQLPLMGAGGSGRRLRVDDQGEDFFWTQEDASKPGHTVPLTSTPLLLRSCTARP